MAELHQCARRAPRGPARHDILNIWVKVLVKKSRRSDTEAFTPYVSRLEADADLAMCLGKRPDALLLRWWKDEILERFVAPSKGRHVIKGR